MKKALSKLRYQFKSGLRHGFKNVIFSRFFFGFVASLSMIISSYDKADRVKDSLNARFHDQEDTFDFIIVGAGTAGCLLANRLSENHKVLLLEAGGEPHPLQRIPGLAFFMVNYKETDYSHRTVPQRRSCFACVDKRASISQGRNLGGSSNINWQVFLRGSPRDYNNWAQITGDHSWSYQEMLPYFKKSENYQGETPDRDAHGFEGELMIDPPAYTGMAKEFIRAGQELGYEHVDLNARYEEGFDTVYSPIEGGERRSSFQAFLEPVRDRENLIIRKYSHATKILVRGFDSTAFGIEYKRHGLKKFAYATKELILSAGAIESAKLLLLSGIGPATQLADLGIPIIADLPVGQNLQDHVSTFLGPFFVDPPRSFLIDRDVSLRGFYEYKSDGHGPLSTSLFQAAALISSHHLKQRGTWNWPDIQLLFSGFGAHKTFPKDLSHAFNLNTKSIKRYYEHASGRDSFFIAVAVARPYGRGEIILEKKDAWATPSINPRYLENDYDMKIMLNGVKTALQLVENTTSFQTLRARFTNRKFPGCDHLGFRSDEYWECYIRHYSVSLNDVAGTCAMGNSNMGIRGVVNSHLEVVGVNHLRVIDASVMPKIVASPTQAAVIAIAEKGADLILEAWKSREGMFSTMPVPSLTTLPPIPGGPQSNNLDPVLYGAPAEQFYGPPEQPNNLSPNYGPPQNNNGGYSNNNNNNVNNQQSSNIAPIFNNNNNQPNFSPPPQFSPPPLPPQTTPSNNNNNNNGFVYSHTTTYNPAASDNFPSNTDLPPAPFDSNNVNQGYGTPNDYPATQMAPPPIFYGPPSSFTNDANFNNQNPPPQAPQFGNPIFGNDEENTYRPFNNNNNINYQDPRNVNGNDNVPEPSTDNPNNLVQDPLPGDPDDENPPRNQNFKTTTPTYDAQASEQSSTTTVATTGTTSLKTSTSTKATTTTGDSLSGPITSSQEISNVFRKAPNRLRNQQASRPKVNHITHDTKKRPGVQISNPHPDLYYNNLSPTNPSGLPSAVNLPHHPLGPVYFRNPEYTVRDPIAIKMGPSTTTTTTTTSQRPPVPLMDDEEHDVANTIARFTTVKPSDNSLSEYYQKHKPKQRPNPIVRYTGLGVTNRVPSTANVADIYYRIMDTTSTDVTSFNNAPELVDFNDSAGSADQTPANSNFFANINSSKAHQPNKVNIQHQNQNQGNHLDEHNDSLVSTSNSFWVNKAEITPGYGFKNGIPTTKSPTTNPYWTNNSPRPELQNNPDNSFESLRQSSSQQPFLDNHASGQTLSQTFYKSPHEQRFNSNPNNDNGNSQNSEITQRPKIKRRPGKVVKIKNVLSWTTRPTTTTTQKPYSVSKQTHVQTYGLAQSANDQMYLDKGVTSQTIVPSGKPFVQPDWQGTGQNEEPQFSGNNDINNGRKSKNFPGKAKSDSKNNDKGETRDHDDSATSHSQNEAQTQYWPPKRGKQNTHLDSFVSHSNDEYEYDQLGSPTTQSPKTWISTVAPSSNFVVNLKLIPPNSEEEDEDENPRSTLKSLAQNIKKSTKGLWNAVSGVWKGNEQETSTSNNKDIKKFSPSSTTSRPYSHVASGDHNVLIKNAIEFGANPANFKATAPEFFAQEKPGIFKRPPFHIDPNIPPPAFPTASSELNTQIPDNNGYNSFIRNPPRGQGQDYTTEQQSQLDSNELVPPLTPPPLVYPNQLDNYRPMFPRPENTQEHDASTNTYDDNERIPGLVPPEFAEAESTRRPHQQQHNNNNNYPDSAEVLSNLAANLNLNPITQNPPTPLHVEIKTHDMDLSTTPRPFLPAYPTTEFPVFNENGITNSFRKDKINQHYDKHLHSFNGGGNQNRGHANHEDNNRHNEFKNNFPQRGNDHNGPSPTLGPDIQGSQNQETYEHSPTPAGRFNIKDPTDTGVFTSEVFAVPLPPSDNTQENVGQIPEFFSPEKNNQNNQENAFPVYNNGNNKESNEFNYNDKDSRGSGSTEKYPEYPSSFEPYQNFNQDGPSFGQNGNIQSATAAEQFPISFVSTVAPNIQLPLASREEFANKLKTLGSSVNDILAQTQEYQSREKNGGSLFDAHPSTGNNFHKNLDPFDVNFKGRPNDNFSPPEEGNNPFISHEQQPTPGSHYNKNEHTGKPHFSSEERKPHQTPPPIFGARIPNHQRNKNIFNLPERITTFGVKENDFASSQNSFEKNRSPETKLEGDGRGFKFGNNNGNGPNNFQENPGSFRDIIKDVFKDSQQTFDQNQYPDFGSSEPIKFGANDNGNNFPAELPQDTNNFNPNANNDNYNENNQFATNPTRGPDPNFNFNNFVPLNSNINDGPGPPILELGSSNDNFPPEDFNPNFVQNSQISYSNPTKFEDDFESTTRNNYHEHFGPESATPGGGTTKEYDITSDPDTVDITVDNTNNVPNRFKSYDITSDPDTVDITEDDPDFPDRFNNIRRNFVQKRRRNKNGRKNGRRRRLRLIRPPNREVPNQENNEFPSTTPMGTRNQQRRRNQMQRNGNGRRNHPPGPGGRINDNSLEINRRTSNVEGDITYIDPPSVETQTSSSSNQNHFSKNSQNNSSRSSNRNYPNNSNYNNKTSISTSESRPIATIVNPPSRSYHETPQNSNYDIVVGKNAISRPQSPNPRNSKPIVGSISNVPIDIDPAGYPILVTGRPQPVFHNPLTSTATNSKNFLVTVGSPTTLKPVSVLQDVTPRKNIASITNIDIAKNSKSGRRIENSQKQGPQPQKQGPQPQKQIQTLQSSSVAKSNNNGTNSVEYDQQADDYYDKLQSFFSSFYQSGSSPSSKEEIQINPQEYPQRSQNKSKKSKGDHSNNTKGHTKGDRSRNTNSKGGGGGGGGSRSKVQNGQQQSQSHITTSISKSPSSRAKGNSNTNSRSSTLVRSSSSTVKDSSKVSNSSSSVHKRVGGGGIAAKLTSTNNNNSNKNSQTQQMPKAKASKASAPSASVSYRNSQSRPKSEDTPHNNNNTNTRTKSRPESTLKTKGGAPATTSTSSESNVSRNSNSRPNLIDISHRNSRSKA